LRGFGNLITDFNAVLGVGILKNQEKQNFILNKRGYRKMANDKRFEKIYSQNMGTMEIWVDKETGVNYLYRQSGYSGGMTVLLDRDGKPVITPVIR
jgi:hypothetical protein